ncbi:uncharacterized protein HD556DRAFT_1445894 [Suillus plorans]|uniref:Uncharacterized protein n=1 Tax=Suillus plorans TaxID=116603 RepID=A0A9P7AL49_9AGAM|nr:uncharacterized protein HD556DRAFT_1445894 [Suillus plorans]KAG1790604.1 hypothetical protein HD556DRAFT_1445894 [Suillus plorans]
MGRRAKYFTLDKKADASQRHRESYSQSQRGKMMRQAQNACAYAKCNGRRGPRTFKIQSEAPLTSSLFQFAALPLPHSYLFHQSLAGSNLIDESDLLQWDKSPPYDFPDPPDSPEEERFTRNLVDVMHGQHLRVERESCAHRTAMYNMGESDRVLEEIREVQKSLISRWDELHTCVSHFQACARHKIMAECYRQWVARRIVNYQTEKDLLIAGKNPYV